METDNNLKTSSATSEAEEVKSSNGVNNGQGDSKKAKLDALENLESSPLLDNLKTFDNFELKSILNQSPEYKRVVLEGAYQNQTAVIILEKKPFAESSLKELLSEGSELSFLFRNDIYGSFDCSPIRKEAVIKTTVIYPATENHIEKYKFSPFVLVEETPELYEKVVLPFIQSSSFSVDWVYNVLEHKKEFERIVFEDRDPETGFGLWPDLKWDGIQLENLYLSAIVIRRDIKSLRDLNQSHLALLENILVKGSKAIEEKYGVKRSQLRIYFHYQPSYYHLHVHFTSLQFNAAGISAEKGHLLQTAISNIKLTGDYYQRATLSYTVKEQGPLYKKLCEYGYRF